MRDPIVSDISADTVLYGYAAAFAVAALFIALSIHALRGRLREA
jgi:hypothetical protein